MQLYFLQSRLVRLSAFTFAFGLICGGAAVTVGQSLRGSDAFDDVPRAAFYDDAVGEMNALGIIQGYDNGKFGPNDPVTRGQIAVLMKRLRDELKGITPPSTSPSTRPTTSSASSSSVPQASSNAAGSIRIASGAYSAVENQGTLQIKLIRSLGTTGTVTVRYALSPGTAKAGEDYIDDSGEATFVDGQVERIITVRILDDAIQEPDETFTFSISTPTGGAVLGTVREAVITVKDNDTAEGSSSVGASTVSFAAQEYIVQEEAGDYLVRVVRSQTGGTLTVNYATSNGTATSPDDYLPIEGTMTFAPGEKEKTLALPIVDDTKIEGNERFFVRLSNASGGAVILFPETVIVINDDETVSYGTGSLQFTQEEYRVKESETEVFVMVERNGGAAGTVSVEYDIIGGTATAGEDYVRVDGTLTFLPGESIKAIKIPLIPDKIMDDYETILMRLSHPGGGAVLNDPLQTSILIIE